ncbi:MAG: succinylglutamate desuccinylase/aspartoacylase family protein [Pseudomonadota bacterium]
MATAAPAALARPPIPPERVERELALLARRAAAPRLGRGRVEHVGQYAFVVRPDVAPGPRIDLLLMALVHGNEPGGLLVLNALCALLDSGLVAPSISIGMVACNVDAARRGVRQVEHDLNRSFGRTDTATAEDRRARELEPMMGAARYCVDLHQTIEPSHTPFFVFGYEPMRLRFAHAIFPEVPVVTHWGRPFSTTPGGGCTTDEFIRRQGGVALGIELGQKGDDVYQVALGTGVCLRAMAVVAGAVGDGGALPALGALGDGLNPLYTWGAVVPYPDTQVTLNPGLANFQQIEAGQVLGTQAGGALLAPSSGRLLFPKYVHSALEPKPPELYRLLRRTHLGELGRGDCMHAPSIRTT